MFRNIFIRLIDLIRKANALIFFRPNSFLCLLSARISFSERAISRNGAVIDDEISVIETRAIIAAMKEGKKLRRAEKQKYCRKSRQQKKSSRVVIS